MKPRAAGQRHNHASEANKAEVRKPLGFKGWARAWLSQTGAQQCKIVVLIIFQTVIPMLVSSPQPCGAQRALREQGAVAAAAEQVSERTVTVDQVRRSERPLRLTVT